MAAFKVFDIQEKGYLTINDFKEVSQDLLGNKNGQSRWLDDVYLIFRRFDRDNDGRLSFLEFS
jgi:Ca2+-binding EF-hand superfamily protein